MSQSSFANSECRLRSLISKPEAHRLPSFRVRTSEQLGMTSHRSNVSTRFIGELTFIKTRQDQDKKRKHPKST